MNKVRDSRPIFSLRLRASGTIAIFIVSLMPTFLATYAVGQTYSVLYAFRGTPDGENPQSSLVIDANGNLYGTTYQGGIQDCIGYGFGCGTVFRINKNGRETILHNFISGLDGLWPIGGVIRDAAGNLYGTTSEGGGTNHGTFIKVNRHGGERVLHSFTGGDGTYPSADLVFDGQGNLYGTTTFGGGSDGGTVFKFDVNQKFSVLFSFSYGYYPRAGLAVDSQGTLYGTTWQGGDTNYCGGYGCGLVFKLTQKGKFTSLYAFTGGSDGTNPLGALVRDKAGNLYGTTSYGGDLSCSLGYYVGCGVVFKITATGKFKVLHTLSMQEGAASYAGLVLDKAGNLYGTASAGGAYGDGSVFELQKDGTFRVLHSFAGGLDGANPLGRLVFDAAGSLYGTTSYGGNLTCYSGITGAGCGTVFKITP
jgi:uncharacterized repeat protein (TIGR03803 family)